LYEEGRYTVNEKLEAEVLTRSSHSSRTSYVVGADLSEMELKKILIEKMEGNKETVTLKRIRDDDEDKDEEPFAGPDPGSKRHREAKSTKAKSPSAPSEVAKTEAQQLKIVLKKSRQQTHISKPGGSGTDEGTSLKPGVPDVPIDESEEELSWNSSDDEVSAIPGIVQHFMDQRLNEAVQVAVQLQSNRLREETQKENDEFLRTVDENIKKIIKGQIILDTYVKTVTLKRRRDDDEDKDEEPFAGPDRGSKRRREGKEPESASTSPEPATKSAGRSTIGFKSRQASASESAFAKEPVQTTSQMEEPSHPEFETGAKDQPIVQPSQHPEWFSQLKKPPTLDHDWN
nr:hypothetical protein [Tanacetum cinerariifolium]